jgi:DNA-binding beta-propeller fold protein YncE
MTLMKDRRATGRRLGTWCLLFALLAAGTARSGVSSAAQGDAPKDGRYYEAAARKAYQAKDYAAFLENIRQAAALRPNHSRLMYFLAVAHALNGNKAEALLWLDGVARMGLVVPAASEESFNSIKDSDEFKAIIEKFRRNSLPLVRSAPAFTVHETGVVPESVAYDPVGKNFYLSSVFKRKILRVGASGEAAEFATERDGLWSVMGMKVDAARRLLWVCTAAHPQMSNYREDENGSTALFKFDLRTGKLVKKYLLPNKPKPHWLGDLVVNSRGDVYATDSVTPAVYVVRRERDEIELFLESDQFSSPQGLDFTADGRSLFMADYAKGVFLIDLKTRRVASLAPAPDSSMLGIDGLYAYRGSLVAVQNGTNPARVVRLFLSKDLSRVERFETLEANNPVFDEPTLGVLVGGDFYFIANSQWGAIDEKGRLAPAGKLREPVVLKIKL